jgi:hypothetical protein
MELLRLLTLAYAAVLVLALASSLIAIWVYLRRIGSALGGAREALSRVAEETEPLDSHLQPLRDLSKEAEQEFWAAKTALEGADEHLGALLERLGLGALTR